MLVRQVNEGRAEVENEFTRAVTRDGNLKAQALVAEVFELRAAFEWRGLGEVPYSALQHHGRLTPPSTPSRASASPTGRCADNKACECGAILRGVKKPQRLQGVRHRVHAGEPDRLLHGVVRRRLRGALHLWPLHATSPMRRRAAHEHGARRTTSGRVDFKHGRVDMTPRQRRPRDGAADRRAVRCAPSTTSTCAQGNDGALRRRRPGAW